MTAHEWQFWLGDLNYRIDLDRNMAKSLIEEQKWQILLDADQLFREKAAERVFKGRHTVLRWVTTIFCYPRFHIISN